MMLKLVATVNLLLMYIYETMQMPQLGKFLKRYSYTLIGKVFSRRSSKEDSSFLTSHSVFLFFRSSVFMLKEQVSNTINIPPTDVLKTLTLAEVSLQVKTHHLLSITIRTCLVRVALSFNVLLLMIRREKLFVKQETVICRMLVSREFGSVSSRLRLGQQVHGHQLSTSSRSQWSNCWLLS